MAWSVFDLSQLVMNQHFAKELLAYEFFYILSGCYANAFLQDLFHDSYSLVWRFAWVRDEIQQSPLCHVFL
ncbi:hypothetical protein F4775DRAFT_589485 [Biscogniauxia sp. FL1348]|nr:hypothetical protein F4775DRAFT_589485 [Biscogniauxia sp. FL1348]